MNYNVGVNVIPGQSVNVISGVSTAVSAIMGNFLTGPLNVAVTTTSMTGWEAIFGNKPAPGTTGYYSVKAFYKQNGQAVLKTIRIASDTAAKATHTFQDRQGTPANTLKVEFKYEGTEGNNYSVDVDDHHILTTTLATDTSASATDATLTSVGGLEVGSDLHFSEGTNDEYVRIISIDVPNKKVYWTGGLTNVYTAAAAAVESMEFALKVYDRGVLVETITGLSMNDEVSFFCEKVAMNKITVTDLKDTDTDYTDLPAATSSASALTSGADGLSDVEADDYKGSQSLKTGIYALDAVSDVFRICCPNPKLTDADPAAAYKTLLQALIDYVENRKTVMLYADVPYGTSLADAITFAGDFESRHLALAWPWLKVTESGLPKWLPPSSFIVGTSVRKDYERGVFKNPGNERLAYAEDVEYAMDDTENTTIADAGLNGIMKFSGEGIRLYGGRTRSAETAWRFIHVSELWNYLGRTLERGLRDIIFEVNDEALWATVIRRVSMMLEVERQRGAITAYQVKMDSNNNPQDQVALGIAKLEVEYIPVGTVERLVISLTSSPAGFAVAA